ncbi:MAG: CPXCG motif-containing cysteine-rich protein [Bdellovibrionaceae bacterium]|nr:CPXCG motif-containing cysteine-rich protein [Pseudobdellovibrionaceae bacterium]
MEHSFQCPYCWSAISMLLDISVGDQGYVEDCERCCQPIQIKYSTSRGELVSFEAERAQ